MLSFEVFLRGARRLSDRVTYQILLVAIAILEAFLGLLYLLLRNPTAGKMVVAPIFLGIVAFVLLVFTWGALSLAAAERGPTGASEVLGSAVQHFGTFIGIALLIVACAAGLAIGLVLLAFIGLGGSTTAPILGLLTPVFLLGGGLGLVTLISVWRLAFAVAAVENSGAGLALRRAVLLIRERTSDTLLFLAADQAIVMGLFTSVVAPLLVGAAIGVAGESAALAGGMASDFSSSLFQGSGRLDRVGPALLGAFALAFGLLVAGSLLAFSTGNMVAFYESIGPHFTAAPPAQRFCDRCGAARSESEAFCDVCGLATVMV